MTFTAHQRAQLRDAVSQSRAEALEDSRRRRSAHVPKTPPEVTRKRPRKTLPTKSEPMFEPTPNELNLADRLMPHIATDSTIDRRRHALGVARMIIRGNRR